MFHEMGSILSWTIDDESLYNTNYAVKVIRDHIKNINEGRIYDYASISNAGGFSKTRSNPNVPKIIDDDPLYDKAGFFSFLSLLYIVITLLVSLVILAIKK